MKKLVLWALVCAAGLTASSQTKENTLLWRISGKDLVKPSYLFGTIHLLCADDIELSPNLKLAIKETDKVYLELDMDNLFEMMQAQGLQKHTALNFYNPEFLCIDRRVLKSY